MAEKPVVCWQCSEYCIYFAELLNIIENLCKENIISTKDTIEKKINCIKDGHKDDKSKKLDDILEYACEEEYLVVEVINDIKSYKLNNMVENKVCSTCSERLYSFVPEDFKVGKEYVDRSTFESLATELFDFKKHVALELQRLGVRREDRDELTDVKEENKDLKLDLLSKEKLINLLLEKICDKPNLREEKCKQIDFDINTEFQSKTKINILIIGGLLHAKKMQTILKIPKNRKVTFLCKTVLMACMKSTVVVMMQLMKMIQKVISFK